MGKIGGDCVIESNREIEDREWQEANTFHVVVVCPTLHRNCTILLFTTEMNVSQTVSFVRASCHDFTRLYHSFPLPPRPPSLVLSYIAKIVNPGSFLCPTDCPISLYFV
jgi:hypothetical protein